MISPLRKGTATVPLLLATPARLRAPADPASGSIRLRLLCGQSIERRPRDIACWEDPERSLRRTCWACLLTAVFCVGATLIALEALTLREPRHPSGQASSGWHASR